MPSRAPDPVPLHRLDRVRPAVELVELGQELVGVVGDLQEPLRDLAPLDLRPRAPAAPVGVDLLVGEHGLLDRVPVDDGELPVGEPLLEELDEEPLLPAVVLGRAGRELARPVVGEAELRELLAHLGDVRVGPRRRRRVVLDRRVLGGQPERVPAHRLEHVEPPHALVARDHVADRVVPDVTHVQAAARVREHAEAVVLLPIRILRDAERLGVAPGVLHGRLDRAEVVVAVHDGVRSAFVSRDRG